MYPLTRPKCRETLSLSLLSYKRENMKCTNNSDPGPLIELVVFETQRQGAGLTSINCPLHHSSKYRGYRYCPNRKRDEIITDTTTQTAKRKLVPGLTLS